MENPTMQALQQKQDMMQQYIAVLKEEILYIHNQPECCDFSLKTKRQRLLKRRLEKLQEWKDSLAAVEAKLQAIEEQKLTD
jgi:hypothetical protein